jgi:hypothetical protein
MPTAVINSRGIRYAAIAFYAVPYRIIVLFLHPIGCVLGTWSTIFSFPNLLTVVSQHTQANREFVFGELFLAISYNHRPCSVFA